MFEAQLFYHVSEESNIAVFEPRLPPSPDSGVQGEVVWAIDQEHLPNYLLPRDCPRSDFQLADRSAGYWIARVPVVPINATEVVDCLAEIEKCGAELRICDTLWPLYDVVVSSALDFSIIRMGNALPRPEG